jgi:exodeoxyribonuclease VII large subunit
MTDLFEDPAPAGNAPEYTVSELSGAVKRVIEGEFGLVRVRGEIGRVSRPASGHSYFDLKDDRAVLAAISWKGQISTWRANRSRRRCRISRITAPEGEVTTPMTCGK